MQVLHERQERENQETNQRRLREIRKGAHVMWIYYFEDGHQEWLEKIDEDYIDKLKDEHGTVIDIKRVDGI